MGDVTEDGARLTRRLVLTDEVAQSRELAARFDSHVDSYPTAIASLSEIASEIDVAIFHVRAQVGISAGFISAWNELSERHIPRLVIVTDLDGEVDFDDIVLIINRVADPVVTPYLVLHDETGNASGLIELETHLVADYSVNPVRRYLADDDLITLVSEFRAEYLENAHEFGDGAFENALLFPAIPCDLTKGFGVDESKKYLDLIPRRS